MTAPLKPYQQAAIDHLRKMLREGKGRVTMTVPAGFGNISQTQAAGRAAWRLMKRADGYHWAARGPHGAAKGVEATRAAAWDRILDTLSGKTP